MKIIGLILTYNCENLVQKAIDNIPKNILHDVICSDDGSSDNTSEILKKNNIKFYTHKHMGYGGNLFFGMRKAFDMGATHVIELHGDGQYDFNAILPSLKLIEEENDLILGNRFYNYLAPLKQGMDPIRYLGNILITTIGNFGLGLKHRDLFPGYRIYSYNFFKKIDIKKTSNNYFFSFEIIAKCKYLNLKISSIPVNCDYKSEHKSMSLINGLPAILHTLKTVFSYRLAKLNIKKGLFKNL